MANKVSMLEFNELCTDLLNQGQAVRFAASGTSMRPTIRNGEIITVEPAEPESVKRGDIVFCAHGKGFVAHRLVRYHLVEGCPPQFVLRGDATCRHEEMCDAPQILGRVIAVERGNRRLALNTTAARLRDGLRRHGLRAARYLVAALRRLKEGCLLKERKGKNDAVVR